MTLTVMTTARRLDPRERAASRSLGDVEIRHAEAQTVDVSTAHRVITCVAAPYGETTIVDVDNKSCFESFSNTAWLDVNEQENRDRLRAVRDHDMVKVFGIVSELDPLDRRGLIAEIKVARTRLGDEQLELAQIGALDASVGFKVPKDGARWIDGGTHRRIVRAWLDHLSLVSSPAYRDARVLAVRRRSRTPRLDLVRAQLAADRYSRIRTR